MVGPTYGSMRMHNITLRTRSRANPPRLLATPALAFCLQQYTRTYLDFTSIYIRRARVDVGNDLFTYTTCTRINASIYMYSYYIGTLFVFAVRNEEHV